MIIRVLPVLVITLVLELGLVQSVIDPTGPPPLPNIVWQPCPKSSQWSPIGTIITWLTYSGSKYCYYFSSWNFRESWHEANDLCRLNLNGTLASIHDSQTNNMLSNRNTTFIEYGSIFWLGLNSMTKRGQYKWSDNSEREFDNYANITSTGDPVPQSPLDQGRCVSFKSVSKASSYSDKRYLGYWFKDDCLTSHRYICQRIMEPTTAPTNAPPLPGNCPPDWFQYANQKCIKYIAATPKVSMNFTQAKVKCIASGAEMLSIHSEEEQNFITAYTVGKPSPYIGLKKGDGNFASWNWDDQKPTDFTNWGVLSTDYYSRRYCTAVITNSSQPGKWDSVYCNETRSVICEKALDTAIATSGITYIDSKCKIPGFKNFIQYRNSCYSIMDFDPNNFLNYTDAEKKCQSMNGSHLVSIVDPFEGAFLRYIVKQYGNSDYYWIGLRSKIDAINNISQAFEWTGDWPVYYTNWDKNQPQFVDLLSDECVTFAKSNGTWSTNLCETKSAYICKASKDKKPKMNTDKSGVCPQLKNATERSMQWIDIDKRSQYCYYFSYDKKGGNYAGLQTWTDASFQCRKRNGTLASIHSNHDSLLLKTKFSKFQGTSYSYNWIGLSHDPNGNFVWEDGSAVGFTNWDPNEKIVSDINNVNVETNRQCVEVQATDGMWRQQPCSGNKRQYYVCEIRKIYRSGPTQSPKQQSSNKPLTGGAKAGIAFGVIAGVLVVLIIGFFAFKNYRPNSPILASFENNLYASKRGNRNGQSSSEQGVNFSNSH